MTSVLRQSFEVGYETALEKYAVSGAMYARALQNASQRSGGRVAPQILSGMAAQPRATVSPFLSGAARAPGALAPSQTQQAIQRTMDKVPFAGYEYHNDAAYGKPSAALPGITNQFNAALQSGGHVHADPLAQARIDQHFGPGVITHSEIPDMHSAPTAGTAVGKRPAATPAHTAF